MEWFCSEEDRSALEKREKKLTFAFRILACVTAAAFIVICLLVRTENAQAMHLALMSVTAVLGWTGIAVWQLGIKECRTQLGHITMLRDGDQKILEGRITLTRESIRIPKSIRIRKMLLDTGEEEPVRLNLNERWISRIPPDGSKVRLAVTHSYLAGVEPLELPAGNTADPGPSRRPAAMRKGLKLLPLLGIWALASVIFCSFVFYQITDTDPAHKLTLYVDSEVRSEAQLAARLEKGLPEPIRMVQVHPFRYAMFGSGALKAADLFIVPDSEKDQFADWFAPEEAGIPVYDPETRISVAGDWILYSAEDTYRLYIGAASAHLADGLARQGAEILLNLETKEK